MNGEAIGTERTTTLHYQPDKRVGGNVYAGSTTVETTAVRQGGTVTEQITSVRHSAERPANAGTLRVEIDGAGERAQS